MLASLIRKAEECEKEERAHDQRPARELEAESELGNIRPNGCWDLSDSRVVAVMVCFRPVFPRCRMLLHKFVEYIRCQRNGKKYIDTGKGH